MFQALLNLVAFLLSTHPRTLTPLKSECNPPCRRASTPSAQCSATSCAFCTKATKSWCRRYVAPSWSHAVPHPLHLTRRVHLISERDAVVPFDSSRTPDLRSGPSAGCLLLCADVEVLCKPLSTHVHVYTQLQPSLRSMKYPPSPLLPTSCVRGSQQGVCLRGAAPGEDGTAASTAPFPCCLRMKAPEGAYC